MATVYTEQHLIAIKEAYGSGITRVTYDGKTSEYRSLAEMKQIIATIELELAAAAGKRLPVAGFASFRRS